LVAQPHSSEQQQQTHLRTTPHLSLPLQQHRPLSTTLVVSLQQHLCLASPQRAQQIMLLLLHQEAPKQHLQQAYAAVKVSFLISLADTSQQQTHRFTSTAGFANKCTPHDHP
jgi:hypothetical protein